MACKMIRTPTDPQCEMKGPAGQSVTLKVVGTQGSASFASARYDGQVLAPNNDELTFTIATGNKNLSVAYTFSNPEKGAAELHEKCDQNTLLDDDINPVNNAKLYRVCGAAASVAGGAGASGSTATHGTGEGIL